MVVIPHAPVLGRNYAVVDRCVLGVRELAWDTIEPPALPDSGVPMPKCATRSRIGRSARRVLVDASGVYVTPSATGDQSRCRR